MRYLVVDACLNSTGIRDEYESGYLNPKDLGISIDVSARLKTWLKRYEQEHYNGYNDESVVDELDREGKEIAYEIMSELSAVKMSYYSDAKMRKEVIKI